MTKEIKKWWDENSESFQKESQVPINITYGPGIPNENKLKLMGNFKGKNVLEIGCGGSQCGISFAKKGAIVTGIDISKKQLEYAKQLSQKHKVKINLLQGDIKNLCQIKSNSQDIVFSSWALLYVNNLKKCFKEVYRVLKKGGIFVFSTHHPFWETINQKKLNVKSPYFNTGRHKRLLRKGTFIWYKTTISKLINTLISAGFSIEKVEEPKARKKDKDISTKIILNNYTKKAMTKIPRTIIIKVRKI